MTLNNFWTRIISGIGLIIVTFYLFYQGPWGLAVFATLISIFGLKEFLSLKQSTPLGFNRFIILQSAIAVASVPLYPYSLRSPMASQWLMDPYGAFISIWFLSIFLTYFFLTLKNSPQATLYLNAHLYITAPLLMLQQLAQPAFSAEYQPLVPILLMVLVWSSDSWAYVSGKLFGKHKLAPNISPGKTWEGLIGGSLLTAFTGFLISYYVFTDWVSPDLPTEKIGYAFQQTLKPWGWIYTPILGLFVGVLGTLGDLYESSIKRKAQVKDSGNVIPGHGGVLDRYDAFLFAIVAMYVLNKVHQPITDFLLKTFGFY
jgi:phosphatidate cytidylyltransferase